MAIKYIDLPESKKTIAILENCQYDAINRIRKMLTGSPFSAYDKKYLMPKTFKATVTCDPRDEYSIQEGRNKAKKKVLKNYYRSVDRRIDMMRESLLELNGKIFETPEELLDK